MKYIWIGLVALLLLVPATVLAENCGVGAPPRVSLDHEIKKLWSPPFFVSHGGEGRHGRQMRHHNICVENRSAND